MASFNAMNQPARFWAFVEELENEGARPASTNHEQPSPGRARSERTGEDRGTRGHGARPRGRGGSGLPGARMDQAMADMQAATRANPEELSSDEDWTPIMTPAESMNEKEVLFDMTAEMEDEIKNESGAKDKEPGGRAGGHGRKGVRASPGDHACVHQEPFTMGDIKSALDANQPITKPTDGSKSNSVGVKQQGGPLPGADQAFEPPTDVFDSPASYVVNFAIPGVRKESIKLVWRSRRGVLFVSGRVVRKAGDIQKSHVLSQTRERAAGVFNRRVPLEFPFDSVHVDANRITAKLDNGVLRVDIPKVQAEKPFSGPIPVAVA